MPNLPNQPNQPNQNTTQTPKVGIVPMSFTIGLCLASIVLSVAGYAFRLMFGDELSQMLPQAAVVIFAFVIGVPVLIWLGSLCVNHFTKAAIHPRNALTLGWLLSVVALLSIMGIYS
ncbi:hypothetical protein [Moraxella marmotae]|uniref:hypothetical protein n=1 Tax=Moraxella marmotae TaxID=3344520 RepID=UPI0035F30EBD